jgi:hypothetical protein
VGHYVNHVPPHKAPNVILIDFNIPYTFYPTSFWRYLPYVSQIDNEKHLRAMVYVAKEVIQHGEELYSDYYEECRTNEGCLYLDWMVDAPMKPGYLCKKEKLNLPSSLVRLIDDKFSGTTKYKQALRMIPTNRVNPLDAKSITTISSDIKKITSGPSNKQIS